MKRTSKLHSSRIDWETIKEVDFNRVVEALLLKLHGGGSASAVAINGRGGDGGIDVAVLDGGVVRVVYQLKFYPEGFTGGFKRARQPEVKNSFETAWKNHAPAEWILVMPPNPHINEKKFVDDLPAGRCVKVEIWGQGKLDAALADHPEIERAALRNELVDVLIQMNMEKAVLVGPQDLSERLTALAELANSRSEYWETSFSFVNGEVEEDYVPKHPEAMMLEPIQTKVTFRFDPENLALAEQVRDGLEFGAFETISLPPAAAAFTREGPSWVKPMRNRPTSRVDLIHETVKSEKTELVTLNFIDEAGYSQGRFEGKILARTHGTKGSQVKMVFANIVALVMRNPDSSEDPKHGLKINFTLVGAPVLDALTALKLAHALQPGRVLELYYAGNRAAKLMLSADPVDLISDPYTKELVDDLVALQQKLPAATFVVPETTVRRDRAMVRVARILLDGHLTVMPPETDLTGVLSGETSEELLRFIREGGRYVSRPTAFTVDIQGSKYVLGPATLFHRDVRVVDAESVLKAIEAGNAENLAISIRPQGDELIQVWLGGAPDERHPVPPYEPWGLTGFDVPHADPTGQL